MKNLLVSGITILLIMLLTACGGDSDEAATTNSGSSSTVVMEASNWKFDQQEYKVPAGDVTIQLKNVEGYHGVAIDGTDLQIDGDGEATVTLEAGEYVIYCSIPCGGEHEEMTAKLIVE